MAAQRNAALKSLEEEVKCPLCMDIFIEPKKLSCDHIICRQCLENLILRTTDGRLICPICRNTTPLQVSNASQFPSAHQVNRLIDIYQKTLQEQSLATLTAAATEQPQLPICSLHTSQPLALYCETCQKTICRDCALTSCATKKHNYGFLKDMAKKYKSEIDKETMPIRKLQQNISEALVAIKLDDERLDKMKKEEQEEMDAAFDAFITRLRQEKFKISSEIEKKFKQQSLNNSAKTKELANSLAELDSNIQLAESMTLEENFTTKVSQITAQKKKLETLHHHFMTLSLKPTQLPGLESKVKFVPEDAKHFLFHEENGYRCRLDEYNMLQSLKVKEPFKIDFLFTSGFNETKIKSTFICLLDNSSISVTVTKLPPNVIRLSFIPQKRGRHELFIQLQNNTNLCGSPFSSYVYIDPKQISSLGKPKQIAIADAAGIKCYDNNIYVCSVETEVIVIEHKKQNLCISRRIPLSGVGEVLIWGQYIYFTNTHKHTLEKATKDGHILASTGGLGSIPGSFNFPNGIRISKQNEIYVCDSNNHRIQVFDMNLNLLRIIGDKETAPGHLEEPYDMVFDEDGNIYVVEYSNNRVQVFTPQGEHLRFIGTSGDNRLLAPISASIYNHHIYITSEGRRCISVFTLTGVFVTFFGKKDGLLPECIDIDRDGYIYVTNDRKTVLKY